MAFYIKAITFIPAPPFDKNRLVPNEPKGIMCRGSKTARRQPRFEIRHIRFPKSSTNGASSPSSGDTRYCSRHESQIGIQSTLESTQNYVSTKRIRVLVQTDPCLVLGVPSTGRTPIRGLLTDTFAQVMIYELYIESQIQMALHAYVILFFTSCKSYD